MAWLEAVTADNKKISVNLAGVVAFREETESSTRLWVYGRDGSLQVNATYAEVRAAIAQYEQPWTNHPA